MCELRNTSTFDKGAFTRHDIEQISSAVGVEKEFVEFPTLCEREKEKIGYIIEYAP